MDTYKIVLLLYYWFDISVHELINILPHLKIVQYEDASLSQLFAFFPFIWIF